MVAETSPTSCPRYGTVEMIEDLLTMLRCPTTGRRLEVVDGELRAVHGGPSYSIEDGVPDLRVPPERLKIDLPWYEPWDDLDALTVGYPQSEPYSGLPQHLDRHLASIPGTRGDGRVVLEVGCGERQCERWFVDHGFRYIGLDYDRRGPGPHVRADAHNLPLADGAVEFYTSMAVYEHLVSPLTAACEAFRVLRPGGTFFGSSAFVYGFHDRASFHHMSHGGLLWTLRAAGFDVVRMWPDWRYTESIPEMAFRGGRGAPWRLWTRWTLAAAERSFVSVSNLARRAAGKRPINTLERILHCAGSVSFHARKPLEDDS